MAVAHRQFFVVAKVPNSQPTGLYTYTCSNETHKIEESPEPEAAADDKFHQQSFKDRHIACQKPRSAQQDRAILSVPPLSQRVLHPLGSKKAILTQDTKSTHKTQVRKARDMLAETRGTLILLYRFKSLSHG